MLTDHALRADLAAKRKRALQQLGERWLLARPVNKDTLRAQWAALCAAQHPSTGQTNAHG